MNYLAHVGRVAALCCCMSAAYADLYFSEYVEGSGFNKALEIYNSGAAAVNLSGYEVRMYFNGSTTATNVISLAGTVAAGDVFVLANAAADIAVVTASDQVDSASWYNGNDAVELALGGLTLDVIGQIGFDPGSTWGNGPVTTVNMTLRRKQTVTSGDDNGGDAFDPAIEWESFPQNTFDDLGTYSGGSGNDSDGDGVPDATDNCIEVANADQYDSNGDNIGSICDADIDGPGGADDCIVNFIDLNSMAAAFFSSPASPSWNPDADLDNSGIVSFADLQVMEAQFFGPPGPSSAGCNQVRKRVYSNGAIGNRTQLSRCRITCVSREKTIRRNRPVASKLRY